MGPLMLLILLDFGQLVRVTIIAFLIWISHLDPFLICLFVFFIFMFESNTYTVHDTFVPLVVKKRS